MRDSQYSIPRTPERQYYYLQGKRDALQTESLGVITIGLILLVIELLAGIPALFVIFVLFGIGISLWLSARREMKKQRVLQAKGRLPHS